MSHEFSRLLDALLPGTGLFGSILDGQVSAGCPGNSLKHQSAKRFTLQWVFGVGLDATMAKDAHADFAFSVRARPEYRPFLILEHGHRERFQFSLRLQIVVQLV